MNKTTKKSTAKKSTSSKKQERLIVTEGYFPRAIDEKYFGKKAKKK